ncbi:MAG: hotdog fold thioesterase [Gammaproteobacteria bacterium]|nr:hotdog fold thioesterase [Gammaproteobacteria bacterium]
MSVTPIWKQPVTLGPVGSQPLPPQPNTLGAHLGLRLTEIGPDFLRGSLPVDGRTMQPFGRLHGGASCALAEELGSTAANLCLDPARAFSVGLEINANHLRAVTGGHVHGTARPLHLGRSTQVWEIRIEDDSGKLVCVSRLTVAVMTHGRNIGGAVESR